MSPVRRNIIANLIGGALLTMLTVVITPLQINILGMEAYGVVGFITTLQIAFTAFDLGLASTLTRELAADDSPDKHQSLELIRTASTIYWLSALVIGAAIAFSAGEIAHRWFNATTIDVALLEQSLRVVALYLGLRWPVALYVGVLAGLQRMDVLNVIKVAAAAIRLIGGVFVLLRWRSLYSFLLWTSFNALLEVLVYWCACRWVYPSLPARPGFSSLAIKKVWRFSLSMNALAILTVLIVQIDRLIISKRLPLDALGVYSLAYNAASIIPAIIAAIGSAVMPSFAAAYGRGLPELLASRYYSASRLMLYIVGFVVATFVFFGDFILTHWVNKTAAESAALPLALLSIGFWGSAVVSNAYSVSVASGRPNIVLRVSFITAFPYAICLYGLVSLLGINGAALAWLLLNASYILFILPQVHRSILHVPLMPFVTGVMVPFVLLMTVFFVSAQLVTTGVLVFPSLKAMLVAFILSATTYIGVGYLLLGKDLQAAFKSSLQSVTQQVSR